MMEQAQNGGSSPMGAMTGADQFNASPFTGGEEVFSSPLVKEEYEKLCRCAAASLDGTRTNTHSYRSIAELCPLHIPHRSLPRVHYDRDMPAPCSQRP